VADFEGTGVAGRKFMKKSDHSVFVFFPASGYRLGTGLYFRGSYGYYWSASLYSQTNGYNLGFSSGGVNPASSYSRFYGCSVRAVQ